MTSFDPRKRLSEEKALSLIKKITEEGETVFTPHVKKRIRERGYSDQDIIHVLENGRIDSCEFDDIRRNWKYKVSGTDIDGDEGIVITAIISNHQQVIVTVF